jgi:hypothetical protein
MLSLTKSSKANTISANKSKGIKNIETKTGIKAFFCEKALGKHCLRQTTFFYCFFNTFYLLELN